MKCALPGCLPVTVTPLQDEAEYRKEEYPALLFRLRHPLRIHMPLKNIVPLVLPALAAAAKERGGTRSRHGPAPTPVVITKNCAAENDFLSRSLA